ncbi:Zn(2+)-responsive transcriptional regulator [Planctobacterium marinum]|uniref:Zn(2+)-responsive transcriptional regulator n=1 Tax=Planctobacterium marinum TaxID=1631968 RepID=UPI001E586AB6|nr:Zn(2+)-responsive transcriptional regulator [Planctobacterium marinum]MCC2605216.1 Zn(2+)-responsive transcriptional regulator [Planctobacterium marinum]
MYKIGQLAKLEAISVEALRFYDQQGVLSPGHRAENGYRLYSEEDRKTLKFIQSAKNLGFTLAEIHELLDIKVDSRSHTCEEVKTIAEHKLQDIQERIRQLQRFETTLKKVVKTCCGGPESAEHCSILEAIEERVA